MTKPHLINILKDFDFCHDVERDGIVEAEQRGYFLDEDERDELLAYIDALTAERDELRAIVEKLPVTGDNVHIIPIIDDLYRVIDGRIRVGIFKSDDPDDPEGVEFDLTGAGEWRYFPVKDCRSTPKAAEAAAKESDDDKA